VNVKEFTDEEKITLITKLGVFSVASLLDELDKDESLLSRSVIETSLVNIVKPTSPTDSNFDIKAIVDWRTKNEEAYRALMILNKARYKN
jgi:3-methyladenine DNA glycosylase AlkC